MTPDQPRMVGNLGLAAAAHKQASETGQEQQRTGRLRDDDGRDRDLSVAEETADIPGKRSTAESGDVGQEEVTAAVAALAEVGADIEAVGHDSRPVQQIEDVAVTNGGQAQWQHINDGTVIQGEG
jgi:hypothetical protein